MPEKRNENKIMAMLERSGVLRKVGSEDGSLETDDASMRGGSDIKPLFETPDDQIKVTPAARQPVPGMPSPVFPSDKPDEAVPPQPRVREGAESERIAIEESPMHEPEDFETSPEPPRPAYSPPPPTPLAPQKPASSFGGLNIFRNGSSPEEASAASSATAERGPQPENYTDRYLNTEELYDALALKSRKTESIYLIEEYLQTLPGSLPDTSRRDIVSKLIAASGFDYDLLMGDGVLRVKMLKEYAERFARHTDDYIAARQAELDELDQQILRTRRLIENRKELHKKQFFSIEAEAQRLKEILTFISG